MPNFYCLLDNADIALNEVVLETFHNELLTMLLYGKYQQVLENLNTFRNQLLNSKINLHLIGNPKKIESTHKLVFDGLKQFVLDEKIVVSFFGNVFKIIFI